MTDHYLELEAAKSQLKDMLSKYGGITDGEEMFSLVNSARGLIEAQLKIGGIMQLHYDESMTELSIRRGLDAKIVTTLEICISITDSKKQADFIEKLIFEYSELIPEEHIKHDRRNSDRE